MTVEAAIALPLVLFAFFALMQLFNVMDADRRMQAVCESVCMEVSEAAGSDVAQTIIYELGGSKEKLAATELLSSVALGEYAKAKAAKAVDDLSIAGIDYLGTQMLLGDDMITIVLNYRYKIPIAILGLSNLNQSVVASRRAWVGEDGISGDGDGEGGDLNEEWVYIGKNPTRYHLTPTCTYLSNHNIQTSTVARAGELGYKACTRCGRNLSAGSTVYVFPGGDKYHRDKECSAVIAYVKKVRRSDVEYLGACTRCGGSH